MTSSWKTYRIGELAEKVAMGPFGSNIKVETFVDKGIPIISGSHLRGIRLFDHEYNFITVDHAERLKNSIVCAGDVVFTHAGNVGQVAVIPSNSMYPRYIISQRQSFLRCNTNLILPEFITYYFHSREGKGKLLANVNSTGVPSLSQPTTYLKSIEIDVPSLEEQHSIVAILDALTNKVVNNSKINHHLASPRSATDSSPDIRRGNKVSRKVASLAFSCRLEPIASKIDVT